MAERVHEILSFSIICLIIGILLLCLWRILNLPVLGWIALGFLVLWIVFSYIGDVIDKTI